MVDKCVQSVGQRRKMLFTHSEADMKWLRAHTTYTEKENIVFSRKNLKLIYHLRKIMAHRLSLVTLCFNMWIYLCSKEYITVYAFLMSSLHN